MEAVLIVVVAVISPARWMDSFKTELEGRLEVNNLLQSCVVET